MRLGEPLQPAARFLDRPVFRLGDRHVGRGISDRPVVFDELVAELVSPRGDRLPGRVVGHHAGRADEKERIGLRGGIARIGNGARHLLAGGAEGAGEWIARPRRAVEIPRRQPDPLRLEEDAIDTAFDIERAAVGAMLADIRHDGVGRRPGGLIGPGLVERLARIGELDFERGKVGGVRDLRLAFQRLDDADEPGELVLEGAGVLFDPREHQPGPGEIVVGLLPDAFELIAPPAGILPGELELFDGGLGLADPGLRGGAAEEHQEHQQGAHRAQQHR